MRNVVNRNVLMKKIEDKEKKEEEEKEEKKEKEEELEEVEESVRTFERRRQNEEKKLIGGSVKKITQGINIHRVFSSSSSSSSSFTFFSSSSFPLFTSSPSH